MSLNAIYVLVYVCSIYSGLFLVEEYCSLFYTPTEIDGLVRLLGL
jgi:hypothetical protein